MGASNSEKKTVLGLSGGVDSTAAALILKEQGFEVTGLFLDVTGSGKGRAEAEALAEKLGIEFIAKDVSQSFSELVISAFCKDYLSGRTPNPCVICNPLVKFRALADTADEIGAAHIATGHYAGICCENGTYFVTVAKNRRKDQSYMLYRLSQDILKRLILPLSDCESKDEIRRLVGAFSIGNEAKKDSQEICFIDNNSNYVNYIEDFSGRKSLPGDFVDGGGKTLGTHKGIANYTIGQRKGLGIALGVPVFVTKIDAEKNQVVLGSDYELFSRNVSAYDCVFTEKKENVLAKIRYAAKPAAAKAEYTETGVTLTFEEPQRAATAGQSLVLYDGDKVIGGGFIG